MDAGRVLVCDTDAMSARLLARVLTAAGVTALPLGEYSFADLAELPEFAVADGIIALSNRTHGVRDECTLRVHKLRGAAYLPGEH